MAATVILDPNGVGAGNAWNLSGAATKQAAVLRPDDDGTSFVWFAAGGVPPQDFTLAVKTGIIAVYTVSVVARMIIAVNGGAPANEEVRCDLLLGGSTTNACALDSTGTTPWTTVTSAPSLARPGGGAWTVADLANLQLRVTGPYTSGASTVEVSTCYVVITCDLASARIGAARDVASRILRIARRPVPVVNL